MFTTKHVGSTRTSSRSQTIRILLSMLVVGLASVVIQVQAATAETIENIGSLDDQNAHVEENMSYWQSFRERHGFDTDEKVVRELARTKFGQDAISNYSVPLAVDEEAVLLQRWSTVEELENADEYLRRTYPDSYAGFHVSSDESWNLVVSFSTNDLDIQAADIQRITASDEVRLRTVRSSIAELEDAAASISQLDGADAPISMFGVDVVNNELEVGIDDGGAVGSKMPPSPNAIDNFTRHVSSAFDVAMTVRSQKQTSHEVCNDAFDCGVNELNRAGVDIYAENVFGQFGSCTAGFLVDLPNPESPATIIPGILTAGHCSDGTGNAALGGDVQIGGQPAKASNHFIHRNTLKNNARTDLAVVGVDSGDASNHIYKSSSKKFRPVTSRKTSGVYTAGDDVCISSPYTGSEFRCGVVEQNNVTINVATPTGYPSIQLRKLVRMNFEWPGEHYCGQSSGSAGASGAPIFINKKALGIWSGCVGQDYVSNEDLTVYKGLFSKIVYAERDLDVTVRTS